MARRYARYVLPNMEKLQHKRGFSKIGLWMEKHPSLFSLQRKRIALGFAIGMSIGVIPLPIQVFASIFFCYLFKANIPATILASLIMNPLTYPFVLALVLQFGSALSHHDISSIDFPSTSLLFSHPSLWFQNFFLVLKEVGILLLIGIPITSLLFGSVSYWLIRFGWYVGVVWQWKSRPWKNSKLE